MNNLQRKHRNKLDFGAAEYYVNFKNLYPEVNINQKVHTLIIKTFMLLVVKKIILEMYRFNFQGLGLFYLIKSKHEIKMNPDGTLKVTAPTNWKETRKIREQTGDKTKKIIFLNNHTNGYVYKIKWDKNSIGFINRSFYSFIPCTHVRKFLAKTLLENVKPLNAYTQ